MYTLPFYDIPAIQFPYSKSIETSLQFPFEDQDNPKVWTTSYDEWMNMVLW